MPSVRLQKRTFSREIKYYNMLPVVLVRGADTARWFLGGHRRCLRGHRLPAAGLSESDDVSSVSPLKAFFLIKCSSFD